MTSAALLLAGFLGGPLTASTNERAPAPGAVAPPAAAAPQAAAAAPPATVTLDDVFRLLREKSPRTAAENARIDVAAAESVAAGVLPNPDLDYSSVHLTGGTNTGAADSRTIVAGQPLLIFGQRHERRRSAELERRAVASEVGADFAERARQARREFVDLLARQERVRFLEEERGDLARVSDVVAARAAAGEKSHYDALRIDLELREREADLSAARAEVEEGAGALAATLGIPGWRPTAAGPLEPAGLDTTDEAALWADARETLPALDAARRNSEAAHEGIALARRERLPVPVLAAGGQFTQDAGSTSFVAGLSLPLPIFDHGQGEIARASARAGAADLEVAARTAEAEADLHRALAVLAERRGTLDQLDRDVISRLPEVRRMSEDAYREGQTDILDLLDALRSRTNAQLERLDALEAVAQAEVEVLALIGKPDWQGPRQETSPPTEPAPRSEPAPQDGPVPAGAPTDGGPTAGGG